MSSLRARLIAVFLAATLVPLAGTVWLTQTLVEHSLSYSGTAEIDRLSRLLERSGREYYQQSRSLLIDDVQTGKLAPRVHSAADRARWPADVSQFAAGGAPSHLAATGQRLDYFVRRGADVLQYSRNLGGPPMSELAGAWRDARGIVDEASGRDLRRGFLATAIVAAAAIWLVSLAVLVLLAYRVSRPMRQLTAALSALAAGDLKVRVPEAGGDEVGAAMSAFNRMAGQLEQSRERLVYLTQVASWQQLARKMAHEVKNSLTPIRLNVEEMVVRAGSADRAFLTSASQIIIDEIGVLERRIRAFSELGSEPPLRCTAIDLAAALDERVAFLRQARPEVVFQVERPAAAVKATADADLLRGILTNLMENAAQAAGPGGVVLLRAGVEGRMASVEVHDSGPGLSPEARRSLFEPTISFKKGGMGLGLSIARKSALSCGGDIVHWEGELGGAAFRVLLPAAQS